MVSFKNLDSDVGLKSLNTHLATRSYIEGYTVSSSDASVLSQLKSKVDGSKYPHVARWQNHISYFTPTVRSSWTASVAGTSTAAAAEEEDDDDFITSLDDDEDEDGEGEDPAQAIIARKNAEREAAKRATKGVSNAKSSVILDIKPEDSDTNLDELLTQIKEIQKEGLTWGGHEYIPVAYGIKKIRLICVVVDELVSIDDLQEAIQDIDGVQSTDIQAFNKL